MPRPVKIPVDDSVIRRWRGRGMTYQAIADRIWQDHRVVVHPTTIAKLCSRLGLTQEYADHKDVLPWRVRPEHYRTHTMDLLRTWARQVKGLPISDPRRERQMLGLLRDLEEHKTGPKVVAYSPVPFTTADGTPVAEQGFYLMDAEGDERVVTSRHFAGAPAPELWAARRG